MKVVLGLGNPGRSYEQTRHNVGWIVLDHLCAEWQADAWRKDGESRIADVRRGSTRVRLVKPQTYMNLSGSVLRPFLRREAWTAANDLLVVTDDVALPLGRYRLRASGSAGGHNGLKSVEAAVGSRDYARLRIGVGSLEEHQKTGDLSDFVLDSFSRSEREVIRELHPTFEDIVETWIRDGPERAMNAFNRRPKPAAD